MARYIGPKQKISRRFGVPIFGTSRSLEKRNYPPGQHGLRAGRALQSAHCEVRPLVRELQPHLALPSLLRRSSARIQRVVLRGQLLGLGQRQARRRLRDDPPRSSGRSTV